MDEQKKQKVMIAVLAVAILGAGTFFWINSGSKTDVASTTTDGPIVRRERAQTPDGDSAPKRREQAARRRAPEEDTTITRRERTETDKTITRRQRGRGNERKEKKQELKPLG